ncbi:hypothetical protein HBI52_165140 [Parastagonospora nodorum]|nr:hypothetical protein HBH46_148280 [Parastagonospora nodorum]KAH5165943.1 hypothetical protein HBH68_243610 [Parastagonospora nodorum]KAH5351030.1 hypothetical protein HBI48_164040 [Parastagonospora nodorum]KAH5502636.1 hypothetical protein HBI52_165140 [Parastagonospora nodorum]KAH6212663.1 hypothetical protein HBI15_143630 [Parastagonospora nodorum]
MTAPHRQAPSKQNMQQISYNNYRIHFSPQSPLHPSTITSLSKMSLTPSRSPSPSPTPSPLPSALSALHTRIGPNITLSLPSIDGLTIRLDRWKTDYLAYTVRIGEFTPKSLYSTYSAWAHIQPGGLSSPTVHVYIYDEEHEEIPAEPEHRRPFQIHELWEDMDLDDEFQQCENVADVEALVVWFFVVAGEEAKGCCWVEPTVEYEVVKRLKGIGRRWMEEKSMVLKVDVNDD